MEQLLRDVRIALRQVLLRQQSFALIVILTLGLAVGLNTVMFSFVNFFVLRPMPFGDSARTVMVFATHPERAGDRMGASYADLMEWRQQATSLEDLGAFTRVPHNLTGSGDPVRIQGALATASLFRIWELEPAIGRVLQDQDDRPGAAGVAILAHGFWLRQFGGDRAILGRAIVLDGVAHEVVGVLDPKIEVGNLSEIEVWTALSRVTDPSDREARNLRVTGRLRPGAEVEQAHAELVALASRQERQHPATNARWSARVVPLRRALSGANVGTILALMAVAVALVLAIACANVANLVLARGIARQRETAVRSALGASRRRLVRQFLIEGVVLAVLGGGLGLVFASLGLDLIRSVTFEPFYQLVTVDRRVLAFTAAISLLSPIVFGLLPALHATRHDLVSSLREASGGAVGASLRRSHTRSVLVVGQLGLALSLLVVAGLTVRMAVAYRQLDLGFETRDLLTFKTELPAARYPADEQVRAFAEQLQARLRAVPGVNGVALGTGRPVLEAVPTEALFVEAVEPGLEQTRPWAGRAVVSSDYFETMRIPILKGRALGPGDGAGAEPVAVVSQALASRYFQGQDPIGKRIRLGAAEAPWRRVVGVAADVFAGDIGQPPQPQAYLPFAQQAARSITVFVRTSNLDSVVAAARQEVGRLDPLQPLFDVKTMERAFYEELASNRVITALFVSFAAVALGLATIGLYGVISFTVSQRTREIGVRVALGAQRSDILGMVVGHGLKLTVAGLVLGLGLGLALARLMAGALTGVSATDPLTFTVVPLALGMVALAACLIPARRAARCDPAVVLRGE